MELGTPDLLNTWLGLPRGAWPPDHYALLGLARAAGDFAEVEARVIDRMELLRPYLLVHPGAVTEGMNRLAQAQVCLSRPRLPAHVPRVGPVTGGPPHAGMGAGRARAGGSSRRADPPHLVTTYSLDATRCAV